MTKKTGEYLQTDKMNDQENWKRPKGRSGVRPKRYEMAREEMLPRI